MGIGSSGYEVSDLQARLMFLGFHPGPIDGEFDPVLEDAVRAYQKANNEGVSGYLDESSLQLLRDNTETQGYDYDLALGGAYDGNYRGKQS